MAVENCQSVTGGIKAILRVEGLCVLIACCAAYHYGAYPWSRFFLFFLVPDISFIGYFLGARLGAASYNSAHSYISPLFCGAISYMLDFSAAMPFLLIWTAHIGFDRAMGYGLKYATSFGDTHLGKIGKWKRQTQVST